jgi:hypothetical protein
VAYLQIIGKVVCQVVEVEIGKLDLRCAFVQTRYGAHISEQFGETVRVGLRLFQEIDAQLVWHAGI